MKKTNFRYGWLEKRKFSAERKRQLKSGIKRYDETLDQSVGTYWKKTEDISKIDNNQQEVLTAFSKSLVNGR